MSDSEVEIYFGPHAWFESHFDPEKDESFLEIVYDEDAERRLFTLKTDQSDPDKDLKRKRPSVVYAYSADYASISEHVITNFAGYIRRLNPRKLLLQNPPRAVVAQMERAFKATIAPYEYPTFTTDVLRALDSGFAAEVIGQDAVKDRLLSALYPLTTGRTSPVVAMFYGPSGVGKTETAKYLNSLLGGDLMRQQFSMFHSDKFGDYIFGGSHSEASFARDLLDRTSGVILLDEFDKAHEVFHSAFYELFDGGAFKDKNYDLDVGPAVIICTSNYSSEKEVRGALGEALYSRFDLVVEFHPLSADNLLVLVDQMVDAEIAALAPDEREVLDLADLRERLRAWSAKVTNVRRLRKLVAEVFSTRLVRAMLDKSDAAPMAGEE